MPRKSKFIGLKPDRDQDMRVKSYKDGYKNGYAAGLDDDHCIDQERAEKRSSLYKIFLTEKQMA